MASSPSLRRLVGVLSALGFLAGCGRTEAVPVTLADLKERTVQFTLEDVDALEGSSSPSAHRFTVSFSGDETDCARLAEGVTATFNGQEMVLESGGGGSAACEPPRAIFDFNPSEWQTEPTEDARVILQDASHTVLLIVREAKTKRGFLPLGGEPTTLRMGETHAYVWVPETDTLEAPAQALLLPKDGGASISFTVEQEGPTARFLLPTETGEGPYVLRLSATARGEVLTCEGVAGCEGSLFHSEEFEVSVTP